MRQLINSIIRQLIINGSAGIDIALAGAILVTRSITGPLAVLKGAALQVGDGAHGASWTIKSRDEIGDLSDSLRAMAANLRQLVRGDQESSEHVFALSQDLSSMAEETGAAVEAVASTANEFSGTSVTMAQNS